MFLSFIKIISWSDATDTDRFVFVMNDNSKHIFEKFFFKMNETL